MRISDWSSDVCSSDLDVHGPLQHVFADAEFLGLLADQAQELHGVDFAFAACLAHGVESGSEERHAGHTRQLDRVLKRQEKAHDRALLRLEFQEVDAIELDLAVRDRKSTRLNSSH